MDAEDRDTEQEQHNDGRQSEEHGEESDDASLIEERQRPRPLPADLPRSLDDRKSYTAYDQPETEYYDAWQGQSQFITAPTLATPLNFNLSLNEPDDEGAFGNDDARVAHMLTSTTRPAENAGEAEEDDVLQDEKLSREQKAASLQDFLFMAASNGDAQRVTRLVRGSPSDLVEIDGVDAEGTPPLVYASCFGHREVVQALLDAGE
jgi:hypothetical protein